MNANDDPSRIDSGATNDVGILFLHHNNDPVTLSHLELIRVSNPNVQVIPISQWGVTLEGGHNARELADECDWVADRFADLPVGTAHTLDPSQREMIWRNADLVIYLWHRSRRESAKRWIVLEWDVFCNISVDEFYAPVWDSDVAATSVPAYRWGSNRVHRSPWYWFRRPELQRLPRRYRAYAAGVAPLAGVLLSDDALGQISDVVLNDPALSQVFCELRMGTVARYLGCELQEIGSLATQTLTGEREFSRCDINVPSIWHKVKTLR